MEKAGRFLGMNKTKDLFFFKRNQWMCGQLGFWQRLWWLFVPGVVINVRWPRGWVVLWENPDGTKVSTESADPNDHYRPELERLIGRQSWAWNWGLADSDATNDRITIKIRQDKAKYATLLALKWA